MAIEKNWLLLTNYAGVLQVMPLGNKPFFEAQNRSIRKIQYKFREMPHAEAMAFIEENGGRDPDFITPKKAANIISDKDRQIEELKAQLAALQQPKSPGDDNGITQAPPRSHHKKIEAPEALAPSEPALV